MSHRGSGLLIAHDHQAFSLKHVDDEVSYDNLPDAGRIQVQIHNGLSSVS